MNGIACYQVYQSEDYGGYAYNGHDLGVQSTADFGYSEEDGVTIRYTSSDYSRLIMSNSTTS